MISDLVLPQAAQHALVAAAPSNITEQLAHVGHSEESQLFMPRVRHPRRL